MELHCQITRGFKPGLINRLSGLKADDAIWTAELCLTLPNSRTLVPARDLARVFPSIIRRLAGGRPIKLLFSHDEKQIENKLTGSNLPLEKKRQGIWATIASPYLPSFLHVLEMVAFTTFYACVDGQTDESNAAHAKDRGFRFLLKSIKKQQFIVAFSLYDESMRIMSACTPVEAVINAVQEVGAKEGLQFFIGSE